MARSAHFPSWFADEYVRVGRGLEKDKYDKYIGDDVVVERWKCT